MNAQLTPMSLEDYLQPGICCELSAYTFTEADIIDFAKKYDPQPFHVFPEIGNNSFLGAHCASGWHTAACWMRAFREFTEERDDSLVKQGFSTPIAGPSPGFEDMRWLRPVKPGDTIRYFTTVEGWRETTSRPGWFIAKAQNEARNQNDELVMSFTSIFFIASPS